MGELGREKISINTEKIVKEQDFQKGIEGKKIEISEEEEKLAGKIVKLYDENREALTEKEKKGGGAALRKLAEKIVSPLPTMGRNSVERVLGRVIEEYEPKKEGTKEYNPNLGIMLSVLINRTAEHLKGKFNYSENESLQEINVSLDTNNLEKSLDRLGDGLPANVRLAILGKAGHNTGWGNKGEIIVMGNCGHNTGWGNKGEIIVMGNCGKNTGQNNEGSITIIGEVKGIGTSTKGKESGIWQIKPATKEVWPKEKKETV